MSFLPEIENGAIVEESESKVFTPPYRNNLHEEEQKFSDLNNLDRPKVTEDFSDSPHLDI